MALDSSSVRDDERVAATRAVGVDWTVTSFGTIDNDGEDLFLRNDSGLGKI